MNVSNLFQPEEWKLADPLNIEKELSGEKLLKN